MSDSNSSPVPRAAMISMVAFSIIGNTPLAAQPMILGALVDRLGFTQSQAGFIASSELVGLSVGILILIPFIESSRRNTFGLISLLLLLTGNVLTAITSDFSLLVVVRFLCGLGTAAAFCVYLNMVSASQKTEQTFATVGACTIVYTGAINLLSPRVLDQYGFVGLLAIFSVIIAICSLTLLGLRQANITGAPQSYRRPEWKGDRDIIVLLAMMLLLYCGHGAIWAYQERIGIATGLSGPDVGGILGMGMLFGGLSGSFAARTVDMKIGRVLPQYISLIASIIAVAILVFAKGSAGFALACTLIAFSWFYGLPYQMGMLAIRDPEGRTASAGLLASTAGMALGPLTAAIIVRGKGYETIGLFAAICYFVAMVIAVGSARRLDAIDAK